ncbi:60S ribosomal export protein NMD3 [Haloferax namakaokahaiae]|uniref:60S ribosomal export protein NMD3 n=1 Tax=Haloferax namakaokahaiae TaxID=1748331 RepID=A0ABD5ZIH6_9EURY
MSESRDFCPRCGDPIPERPEPLPGMPRERDDVLCDACYFEDFDLVDAPDKIRVRVCAQCGAVHRGNRWVDVGAQDYTDVAIDEVSQSLGVHINAEEIQWGVEPEQIDQNNIRMHCHFSGVVRGTPLEETVVVPVSIARETCQRCGRIAGGYFASIIQVRADTRVPTKEEAERAIEIAESYIAEREQKGDRNAFITEVDRAPDGPNMKISSNQMASGIAKRIREELGGTIDEHPTLVTEDGDGNEVYRVTFVTRLPRFVEGDIIDPEDGDGPVLVRSNRGRLHGTRLASGKEYVAEFEEGENPDAEPLGSVEDAEETTVVTVEDDHAVQVLDPVTFEAKTIPRPDYFDPDAQTVSVLKSPVGLHILPDAVVEDDE